MAMPDKRHSKKLLPKLPRSADLAILAVHQPCWGCGFYGTVLIRINYFVGSKQFFQLKKHFLGSVFQIKSRIPSPVFARF